MIVPMKGSSSRLVRKNSTFLGEVFPVRSEEEIKQIVETLRGKHPKCSHVVWAFSLGDCPPRYRSSDDGEPKGTAGKPVLDVIRYKELTDILITVVRYFGGTKLGTGGLVKAYSDSANAALEKASVRRVVPTVTVKLTVDYSRYEPVKRIVESEGGTIEEEAFQTAVTIMCTVPEERAETLLRRCTDATGGGLAVEEVE